MSLPVDHPPFGAADLSNCEREQIHLAGSIQPHGVLLVLREPELTIVQASDNAHEILGIAHRELLGNPVSLLHGDIAEQISALARTNLLTQATPVRCTIVASGATVTLECMLHRQSQSGLIVELQATDSLPVTPESLPTALAEAVRRITSAGTLAQLSDEVVKYVRALTGYDRVMVYQFDVDGHGEVIAEAREEQLEPFLGQHYPASDIPQRARELYLRNRVRVLVDVHYEPVPVVPRLSPQSGQDLDMSLCILRSMSPLHLQYLQNMGVSATLVASLVREERLWGLIACHHYSARTVAGEMRTACELLSEVISTRISALENREPSCRRSRLGLSAAITTPCSTRHRSHA